ncbi:MAG: S8 family peptidase [Myxococcaceae bacterium]
MSIRTWMSSLFLVASILALPSYAESNNNRLIVRFKEGISSFAASTIHKSLGLRSQKRLQHLGAVEIVELPKNMSLSAAQKLYVKNPQVLYAEPDFTIRVNPIRSTLLHKKDEQYSQQWALNNIGQKVGKIDGKVDADINAPEAWNVTKGDRDVVLGIIDTGILYTHPDLVDNVWTNAGEIPGNNKDDDGDGYIDDVHGINAMDKTGDPLDDNGHGTHCSGIMGGTNTKGQGIFGVNQKVSIVGCKFLDSDGSGNMSDALVCMDYFTKLKTRTDNPVNLVAINASWGGRSSSKAMQDAIKVLGDNGILFVAAAGNDTEDNDKKASFPANFKLANIISVAATNNRDELSSFSNFGNKSVHVAAPGEDILSTYLDNGYETLSGTSMATPHATGLIGLLKAKDPSLTPIQLKNLVMAGGTSLNILSGKVISSRRIRAADKDGKGSLTCSNQRTHVRISPETSVVSAKVGEIVDFAVMNIKCGAPDGAPRMAVSMGHSVDLLDVDEDGVYSAQWTPDSPGSYDFDLGDGETVTVNVE